MSFDRGTSVSRSDDTSEDDELTKKAHDVRFFYASSTIRGATAVMSTGLAIAQARGWRFEYPS